MIALPSICRSLAPFIVKNRNGRCFIPSGSLRLISKCVESRERAPRMRPLFTRVAVHRFFVLREGSLEASYTFAQALAQFGDILGAEHQNHNAEDDQFRRTRSSDSRRLPIQRTI